MSAEQGSAEQKPTGEPTTPHVPEGLELARAMTRATAAAGGALARKRGPVRQQPDGPEAGSARRPRMLSDDVSKLVDEQGWELSLRVRSIFARWPELVGAENAAHATPESFTDGILVIRTDSTHWAQALRLLIPDLLRALNEALGPATVNVVEVLGPQLPSHVKKTPWVRGARGPRDTWG